ncbi:PREDICTED: interleukin-31 receptor subunit alpha isoform X3 [Bison bison bison]|uniref:Interleukin-31 receptor subunit alpha n=1 Tax=Bison bison bison TaxID=43346 RepID=A0A6P3IIX0_BISBB|nr:PREDICTED: interleukin-31 receptor subunit alpha isoform X3 [Bison bison bison]
MWAWTLWMLPLLCRFGLADLPAKPENISCVFYYTKNFTCTWSPEKEANSISYTVRRTLCYVRENDTCNSTSKAGSSCSFYSSLTPPDIYIIQVEAKNAYGIIKSDITYWDLTTITKIEPPKISSVKPVLGLKQMVQIKWTQPVLAPKSSTLNYTLRFRAVNSTHWMEVNFTRSGKNEEEAYNLTGLQAFTEYVVALQCVVHKSRFWSGWSQEKMGVTVEEAPHGLDLWRVLRSDKVDGKRPVQLLLKKAKGAPVLEKVLGYKIQYFPENNSNLRETMNTTNQQPELYLGNQTYWVHVRSYNSLGESPEATLRIPAIDEKLFHCIEAMHTCLTQDQLVVEWQSSALEVDTWMVEWVPDVDSKPSAISWESVSHARNWTIQQDELEPFWCYNISVYPMLQNLVGEPYSIQAYVKEGAKTVNSSILQYDLESLTRKTSYTVQVMASTSAGGINGTGINFKTLSISVFEIFLVTSLVGGGLLILIILTVVYGIKKPNKLKHLCWPDVPNPAESSIATWCGDDFKGKLNLKEFDDSVNREDGILKPCYSPNDFIDKLVVNFENFLEVVSAENPGKGCENILGGEKNEYVASPNRPYCPTVSTEIPPRGPQCLSSGMLEGTCPETRERLLPPTQGCGPDHLCEEGAPNPYLKNSVTTREFLVSEKLPEQIHREV